MTQQHTVKSFDDELKNLDRVIAEMGRLCIANLADSVNAILKHDPKYAEDLVRADLTIDKLEQELTERAIDLLALRQPMAADLRTIVAALKTGAILERVGDYAKNIAKRSIAVAEVNSVGPIHTLGRLADAVQDMLKIVLEAYLAHDTQKARQVVADDSKVDMLHTSFFRELLTYMLEDPRTISSGIHLLFVAKHLERVGDQATNIAENLVYIVEGETGSIDRSKADESSYVAAKPPAGKANTGGRA
jgi:phosphate transport system protein